jgi:hypothetical protein
LERGRAHACACGPAGDVEMGPVWWAELGRTCWALDGWGGASLGWAAHGCAVIGGGGWPRPPAFAIHILYIFTAADGTGEEQLGHRLHCVDMSILHR